MRVIVETYNLDTGELHDSRSVNLDRSRGREWLYKRHIVWAVSNGYGLQIRNELDNVGEWENDE